MSLDGVATTESSNDACVKGPANSSGKHLRRGMDWLHVE